MCELTLNLYRHGMETKLTYLGKGLLQFDNIPECDWSSKVVHQPLRNYM